MRIENLKAKLQRRPHYALVLAAIFHVTIALSVFSIGRLGLAQQFDRDGIGDFASDGHLHKPVMDSLVNTLQQGEFGAWINSKETFHVKVFSLSGVVMEPLVGSNILTIEPLNLLYYLALLLLTFTLARLIAGLRAAWLATLIVAIWPSLLLHGTQFLRDPLVIISLLTLFSLLALILKRSLTWRPATAATVAGAAAIYVAWQTRPEMWLVVTAIIVAAALLLLAKLAVTRNILATNLLVMAALVALAIGIPRPAVGVISLPLSSAVTRPSSGTPVHAPLWARLAIAREKFVVFGRESGSGIDEDVAFNSASDIIRYTPRALEIGYFAPFPAEWFRRGNKVGVAGRILSGFEMSLTYLFEALACLFVWQTRTRFSSWLLFFATTIGMLALGLVVTNVGTLFRMRYPFWILIVIMAASFLASSAWFSGERTNILPPRSAHRNPPPDQGTDLAHIRTSDARAASVSSTTR